MTYHIKVVGDAELPQGIDWVVARIGDLCYLFIKAAAAIAGIVVPVEARKAMRRFSELAAA